MDSQELEGLNLSQHLPPTGDERANQIQELMPTTFLLTLAQGKCLLDINMSMGQNSQQIKLVVPASISIGSLKKLILQTADNSSSTIPSDASLVISFNHKELQENSLLFQSLLDPSKMIDDKGKSAAHPNRSTTLQKFLTADEILRRHSE